MTSSLKIISRAMIVLWRLKLGILRIILFITGILVAALIFAQVMIRYFTSGSVYGFEEMALTFAVWFYFIGAAYGAYTRSHVSASLMDVMLPEGRSRDYTGFVTSVITAVLSVWMSVCAVQYVLWVHDRGMVSLEFGFSMVYVHVSVAIGLALMSLYFIIEAIERLISLFRGTNYTPQGTSVDEERDNRPTPNASVSMVILGEDRS